MEWTGQQQILFLLQSMCLGVVQGVLFDIVTGIGRSFSQSWRVIWDALLGPLTAIITFCGALIIMDGQLHPLLLGGSVIGMLLEHLTIGRWLSALVVVICRVPRMLFHFVYAFCSRLGHFWRESVRTSRKKLKKQRKSAKIEDVF